MDDPNVPSPVGPTDAAAEAAGPTGAPKGLKRRLRWSTRGGEIIRSDGPHEVSVAEGAGNATGRVAIPQSEEPRTTGGDRIAYGPKRVVGVSSRDRFETGQALGPGARDRFESAPGAGSGPADRFEGGAAEEALRDRYATAPAPSTPSSSGEQGPVVGAEQLKDRFAGGAAGAGIRDRMQGGGVPGGPASRSEGPTLEPTGFNDFYVGGPGSQAPTAPREGPKTGSSLQDRNLAGQAGAGYQDRMQGGQGPEARADRYEGAGEAAAPTDRYAEVPDGRVERDRLDLPEDIQTRTQDPHRGSRKPLRVDELLRQVPKPLFQPVEIFKDIQGLSKRMTGIRYETADIRGKLSPALPATASDDPSRKVSQWLKRKIPK